MLRGVVSWSAGACKDGPGVFMSTLHQRDWIHDTLAGKSQALDETTGIQTSSKPQHSFRLACTKDNGTETLRFLACLLSNGTEVEGGSEWVEGRFVYGCEIGGEGETASVSAVACMDSRSRKRENKERWPGKRSHSLGPWRHLCYK